MQSKLSIVTINYNNASGLEKTIGSVTMQRYKPIEYIVIDGGSSDGSKELIEKNKEPLSYWVSEKDNGVYHAMNKGIKVATGEYLLFLNSGDCFYSPDSLQKLLAGSNNEDIIYGDMFLRNKEATHRLSYPSLLSFDFFLKDTLAHPSSLIKRSLFEKVGLYNEENRIVSDWAFFLDAICRYNATYKYVPVPVVEFDDGGISTDPENKELIAQEKKFHLSHYYASFLPDYNELNEKRRALKRINGSWLHLLIIKMHHSGLYNFLLRLFRIR